MFSAGADRNGQLDASAHAVAPHGPPRRRHRRRRAGARMRTCDGGAELNAVARGLSQGTHTKHRTGRSAYAHVICRPRAMCPGSPASLPRHDAYGPGAPSVAGARPVRVPEARGQRLISLIFSIRVMTLSSSSSPAPKWTWPRPGRRPQQRRGRRGRLPGPGHSRWQLNGLQNVAHCRYGDPARQPTHRPERKVRAKTVVRGAARQR